MKQVTHGSTRRQFLRQTTTGLGAAALLASGIAKGQEVKPLFIEGYSGQVSYAPGEEVTVHVTTSAANFTLEVARQGLKPDVVLSKSGIAGKEFSVPDNASSHGCGWPAAFTFKIPTDWRSGYYAITLRASDNGGKFTQRGKRLVESNCFFVLRPAVPGSTSKILLQLSTNTYNAYNNWGGFSLYAYNGRGGNQGHRVSYERPPASQFNNWELPFVQWAERNGYQLEYAANPDLEFHPEMLKAYKLVLSVGHDEYWSAAMRDNLEKFIAGGGNVAFFSGNTCCWQVRSEEGGKALTSWKQNYGQDPLFTGGNHQLLSTLWSHHLVKRPENQLTGVGFLQGGYRKSHSQFMDEPAEYTIHHPDHWIFAGTGVKRGDKFGDKDTIVGYECDGCEVTWKDGLPVPTNKDGTPEGFTILASCPVKWHPDDCEWYDRWEKGRVGNSCLGLYTRGGTVFTTGSTDWAHGLRGGDKIVERVTKNILDRLT